MRLFRTIAALLVATGLAILPVSAFTAVAHAAKSEMAMTASGDECPCCERALSDACPIVCCHMSVLVAEGWAMPKPQPARFVDGEANTLLAFLERPDPPPPRS